ncbi:MAG: AI-2E family transporter [Corynebacterium sp.]|uniref:AI-2E family transporter n=1 Tax=Corynebacterium sp. TaxID=1720 RepID=UPI0026DB4670|nr:AI-2E family transporter [Corynebacterium sp.]MDO5097162.1 AI-2E family transporter [Corynebacterium sp.]
MDHIDRAEIIADGIRKLATWCLRLLIITAAAFVLWYAIKQLWRGALPIVLAIIVCTVLWPPVAGLRRLGVPRALASLTAILGAVGAFSFLIWMIAPSVGRQSHALYFQAFEGIQRLQLWLQGPPFNLDSDDLDDRINSAVQWVQRRTGSIVSEIFSGLGIATSVIVTLGIVLVLTFFFLKDGDRFLPWLRGIVGKRAGWHLTELCARAWITLGGFIRAQATVSAVDAIFIGIGLIILGVPMALALAVLTFLGGFIPIVGAFVAGTLAVLVALVSLGVTKAIMALAIVLLVQQLEGNILQPLLQSRALNLHPVVILVSVTVGGSLFSIIGAFLAVPFAAMVAVLFRYLHDMTALRAGEKQASEIEFVTTAGSMSGLWGEEIGRKLRANRVAAHDALVDAAADAHSTDNHAAPGSADHDDRLDAEPMVRRRTNRYSSNGKMSRLAVRSAQMQNKTKQMFEKIRRFRN